MDQRKTKNKSRRRKRLFWICGVLILVVGLVIIAALLWLAPVVVSWQAEKELSKAWGGQVDIEDLELNYFGPVRLGKITFYDETGRRFIQTGKVKIVLEKWPSLQPVLTEIEIEKLIIRLFASDGKFMLPVIPSYEKSNSSQKEIDIRKFSINNVEIIAKDTQKAATLYDNLRILVDKKDVFYDFVLKRIDSTASESLLAEGRIDLQTLRMELSLRLNHIVKKPEMALVFAALNVPNLSAEGKIGADLKITGPLKLPVELTPEGTINIDEWTILKDEKIITNNLATKADIKDERFELENITATVFDGNVAGALHIETKQNRLTVFDGRVSAQKIDFAKLTSILGDPNTKATKGTVTFDYNFSCNGKDLENLTGEGRIFLNDADIGIIPVIASVFKNIGLTKLDPLKISDARCTFTTGGPVVTIKTAHIANRFAAVRAEPGGTINLQTKQIDIHIVAAPLKLIDTIVKNIPVVNIIDNLKDKLIRLRVQGSWFEPPSKLIKKEPIKDIKDATVGFLRDVINSGGQITQGMRKRFGSNNKTKDVQKSD